MNLHTDRKDRYYCHGGLKFPSLPEGSPGLFFLPQDTVKHVPLLLQLDLVGWTPFMGSNTLAPILTPHGRLTLDPMVEGPALDPSLAQRLHDAFARGSGHGLLQLGC